MIRSLLTFVAINFCFSFAVQAKLVIDEDFPDPMVIAVGTGYVAYATGSESGRMILMAKSKDLIVWTKPREVLAHKPAWSSQKKKFWAPHVVQRNGLFVMFFSAEPDWSKFENMRIGIAVSRNAEGPFRPLNQPLDTADAEENIDPAIFEDGGSTYLYWARNGEIAAQKLDPSLLHFARYSSPVTVIKPDAKRNYENIVEGPFVFKKDGWYLMVYSGDDCCDRYHYAVLLARSRTPMGPFQKLGPIVEGDRAWLAPGHAAVLENRGRYALFFHAIRRGSERDGQNRLVRRLHAIRL